MGEGEGETVFGNVDMIVECPVVFRHTVQSLVAPYLTDDIECAAKSRTVNQAEGRGGLSRA